MKDYKYNGYLAKYHCPGSTWSALIYAPNSRIALGTIPTATREDGEEVLLGRVREAIDADIKS